ncbi:hypothetical protein N665_4783s0005 [Sinapis alba]|nr:hypothetical protein N665_4783s0005 [Sinapis alba]
MGKEKVKWTEDEEDAFLAGVRKHGPGKWKNILRDPEFAGVLSLRSNINLKDKWRNLSVPSDIQGSKDKVRTPKIKAAAFQLAAAAATTPTPSSVSSPVTAPLPRSGSSDLSIDDSYNLLIDSKNAPRYDGMIFEALSALKDANGSDVTTIFNFIEQKMYEVPEQFKRVLGSRLRRLAAQGKLEKTQNFYKMNNNSFLAMRTPVAARQKEVNVKPRQTANSQGLTVSQEKIANASGTAAFKLYEGDGKLEVLSGLVDERERLTELSERAEMMLLLAEELHERCFQGEIVELN